MSDSSSPAPVGPPAPYAPQIRRYTDNAKAANTRKAYRIDWDDFVGWCALHGCVSIPATPETVAEYLVHLADAPAPLLLHLRRPPGARPRAREPSSVGPGDDNAPGDPAHPRDRPGAEDAARHPGPQPARRCVRAAAVSPLPQRASACSWVWKADAGAPARVGSEEDVDAGRGDANPR